MPRGRAVPARCPPVCPARRAAALTHALGRSPTPPGPWPDHPQSQACSAPFCCLDISPLGLGHTSGANSHLLLRTPLSPQVGGGGSLRLLCPLAKQEPLLSGSPWTPAGVRVSSPAQGLDLAAFSGNTRGMSPVGWHQGAPSSWRGRVYWNAQKVPGRVGELERGSETMGRQDHSRPIGKRGQRSLVGT